ncbi:MAG: hypothetical protein NTY74_04815 [Ignavibacteriae bacterium]|nr:hypothetical protein [Ignavibacteriota bacterium]
MKNNKLDEYFSKEATEKRRKDSQFENDIFMLICGFNIGMLISLIIHIMI